MVRFLLVFAIAMPANIGLANAAQKGKAIVKAAEDFHENFKDCTVDGTMILEDASGATSRREMKLKVLEDMDDGNDSLMVFNTPKDIKGTTMLTDAHVEADDDQWIYLPALKRVKRITTSNRSGPFLGSEFTYEDLVPRTIDKYRYRFAGEEKCGKEKCNVIMVFPKDKKSAYQRQKTWITQDQYLTMKTEFYDRKDKHIKTMIYEGYKKYQDKHWGVDKVTMTNHKTKKSTTFLYKNYKYGTGLNKRDFDQSALKRGR